MDHSSTYFDDEGRFVIQQYHLQKPFTNFLSGIAGLHGIPLWVFYTNRNQAISSFGLRNKDGAILEFQSADKAYRLTGLLGFRTFIRKSFGESTKIFEPFASSPGSNSHRQMRLSSGELEIVDIDPDFGVETSVTYFTIPNESFAGLARRVQIKNISQDSISIEMADGLPMLIPGGVTNDQLKNMSRTSEAWMRTSAVAHNAVYYSLASEVGDEALVQRANFGSFALTFSDQTENLEVPKIIHDPSLLFGHGYDISSPSIFQEHGLQELISSSQRQQGYFPCSFALTGGQIDPDNSIILNSIFGSVKTRTDLAEALPKIDRKYLEEKRSENKEIENRLTRRIKTRSGKAAFDVYAKQTFLDNGLRGGFPLKVGITEFHVFGRKHGDPERDYNFFELEPSAYSQGNGNYRDLNQNRRNDVFFFPEIEDSNLIDFISLIQFDGYNPLEIRGSHFSLAENAVKKLGKLHGFSDSVRKLLGEDFTPGELFSRLSEGIEDQQNVLISFEAIMGMASSHIQAMPGDGYWIDHWTYCLDLLDTFEAIYPDELAETLFDKRVLPWFRNSKRILTREERVALIDGELRQIRFLEDENPELESSKPIATTADSWEQSQSGSLILSSVFEKLFLLQFVKAASLDPDAMGIEMEAGRPGWNDALNGLPAQFGSSTGELYELSRLNRYLDQVLFSADDAIEIKLPVEAIDYIGDLIKIIVAKEVSEPERWQRRGAALDAFRKLIYQGLSGKQNELGMDRLAHWSTTLREYLNNACERLEQSYSQVLPMYFTHVYEGEWEMGHRLEGAHFRKKPLPEFLEGYVHKMRWLEASEAGQLANEVRASGLHDAQLGMYKSNVDLSQEKFSIGRIRSFPRGWLENESIWLHMEYKFLLECLRSGDYASFFEDFQQVLVPFIEYAQYGRSPSENSSFIVSSVFEDEAIHGSGYLARLSGSTAEFLSIWFEMLAGRYPFFLEKDSLFLELKPIIPSWLFPEDGVFEFTFLGKVSVQYHNPEKRDTWEMKPTSTSIHHQDGTFHQFDGAVIPYPFSEQVRDGIVRSITVDFSDDINE